MRVFLLPAVASLAVLLVPAGVPQDPVKVAKPPADRELLPPVQDPPPTRVDRSDLIQRFVPDTPLTGFWRLRSLTIGARELTDEVRGYLAIGRTHLSLHVVQATDDQVLVQSGFRTYRIEEDEFVTNALMGFDNHQDGALRFEPVGFVERRRFEVAGPRLRVMQGNDRYMEFERVE